MAETEPGVKTTEFLQAGVAALIGVYTAFAAASETVQVAGLACLTVVVCVYIWSRTKVKSNGNA